MSWSAQDDELLIRLANEGRSTKYIAHELGRSMTNTKKRRSLLMNNGLVPRRRPGLKRLTAEERRAHDAERQRRHRDARPPSATPHHITPVRMIISPFETLPDGSMVRTIRGI